MKKFLRKTARGVGKVIKPLVNFPRWMGLKQISQNGKAIVENAQSLMQRSKASHKETFEEAVQRLHLSEQDIQQKQKDYLRATLIYGCITFLLFIYAIFLLFTNHLAAAFLSILLTVLGVTFTIKQHFLYFQIKRRKLGCTLKDWFAFVCKGAKS